MRTTAVAAPTEVPAPRLERPARPSNLRRIWSAVIGAIRALLTVGEGFSPAELTPFQESLGEELRRQAALRGTNEREWEWQER